jgi:hypothetical protein
VTARRASPPRRRVLRTAFGTAVLLVVGVAGAAVAAPAGGVSFRGPSAYGVVHLGDRVEADLAGPCARAVSRVRAVVPGGVVHGSAARGCHPVVTVPTAAVLARRGYREGQPITLSVVAGGASQPLAYARREPFAVASGSPTVVRNVSDPYGGVDGLAMSSGDVVDLGRADLTGLQSVGVRNLSSGTGQWELRVASPTGAAVASGQLGSAGSIASAGSKGWFHSVGELQLRPAEAVLGDTNTFGDLTPDTGSAPRLFLAVVAVAAPEPVVVNWVDLNGSGVALPHRFASERGFDVLFDGSSFDGWRHIGPGRFVLRDGAMRAEHDPQDRGWAWLWWSRAQYSDFVLRLRFKVEDYEDNGGVLLRHVDPMGDPNRATNSGDEVQIQDGFENHTGGFAHQADATRLATGVAGQWNDLEIVAVGRTYVVRINGTEVSRFLSKKALRGFVAVENEQLAGTEGGHLWYDDVRLHRCSAGDSVCRV